MLKMLNDRSIASRHFAEIGLATPRLHDWVEATGFGPDTRGSQKWRRFSPGDVVRLGTVRSIKNRTQMAISEQGDLLGFVGHKDFVLETSRLWGQRMAPTLVTDLASYHEVVPVAYVSLGSMVKRGGPLFLALSLDGPVRLMLAAMIRGGSADQKAAAIGLVVHTKEDAKREAKRQRALDIYPDGDADGALRYLLPGLSEELGVHRTSRRTV